MQKNDNTKPKHLIHANPRPPQRYQLNATSMCALEDEVVMTKRKRGKTDQRLTLTSSRHPNQTDPRPKHLSTSNIRKRKASINQKGTKTQHLLIGWQSTTEDRRKCENERTLLVFFGGHPKPLPKKKHNHHVPLHCIPNGSSERIKRKYVETMTKIEKKKGATPLDVPSQAKDPDSFLYEDSAKMNTRKTDTCVISIR